MYRLASNELFLLLALQGRLDLLEYFEEDRSVDEVLDLATLIQKVSEVEGVEFGELLV